MDTMVSSRCRRVNLRNVSCVQAPMIPLTALVINLAETHFGAALVDAGIRLGSHDRLESVLKTAGFGDIRVIMLVWPAQSLSVPLRPWQMSTPS